jgi:hypothetical protein
MPSIDPANSDHHVPVAELRLVALANMEKLAEGDVRLFELLKQSVIRQLERELARSPDALLQYEIFFNRPRSQLEHVRDWLRASIVSDAPWLSKVDANGIPKKLAKLGSFDALLREADKQMARANTRLEIGTELVAAEEELDMEFQDGWRMVRLLTVGALDRESVRMQHCIGHGGYDKRLLDRKHAYLSLRDPANKPHATLEIVKANAVTSGHVEQLVGKQNSSPKRCYLERLATYLELRSIVVNQEELVSDIHGRVYLYDDLPERLETNSNVTFRSGGVRRMPKVIHACSVHFIGGFDVMPDEVVAERNLTLEGDMPIPLDLKIGGTLRIVGNRVADRLPSGLEVENLILLQTPRLTLPPGLTVNGQLRINASDMAITSIPEDARFREVYISGLDIEVFDTAGFMPPRTSDDRGPKLVASRSKLREIRGEKRFSHLDISFTGLEKLPDDLVVTRFLDISKTAITHLPERVVPKIMLVARECRDLTLPGFLDCEEVRLSGSNVRFPKHVSSIGDVIMEKSVILRPPYSFKAKALVFDGAVCEKLPTVVEAEFLSLRGTDARSLPPGLSVSIVSVASGPLCIPQRADFGTLRVYPGKNTRGRFRDLSRQEAIREVDSTGGVGLEWDDIDEGRRPIFDEFARPFSEAHRLDSLEKRRNARMAISRLPV